MSARGDARLDMLSDSFDAAEALLRQPQHVALPYPAIRAVDNVARWLSITQAQARQREAELKKREQETQRQRQREAEARHEVDYTMHPNHPLNREKNRLALSEKERAEREQRSLRAQRRQGRHVLARMQRKKPAREK